MLSLPQSVEMLPHKFEIAKITKFAIDEKVFENVDAAFAKKATCLRAMTKAPKEISESSS